MQYIRTVHLLVESIALLCAANLPPSTELASALVSDGACCAPGAQKRHLCSYDSWLQVRAQRRSPRVAATIKRFHGMRTKNNISLLDAVAADTDLLALTEEPAETSASMRNDIIGPKHRDTLSPSSMATEIATIMLQAANRSASALLSAARTFFPSQRAANSTTTLVGADNSNKQALTSAPDMVASASDALPTIFQPTPSRKSTDNTLGCMRYTPPLNETGYQAIMNMSSRRCVEDGMRKFVQRVIDDEGLCVKNQGALSGFLPYYNGGCASQSYTKLVFELHATVNRSSLCGGDWLDFGGSCAETKMLSLKSPSAISLLSEQEGLQTDLQPSTLSQSGYLEVAATNSREKMELFMRRVIEQENMQITDEVGLHGMAPFYLQACGSHTFAGLLEDIRAVPKKRAVCGGGWLKHADM